MEQMKQYFLHRKKFWNVDDEIIYIGTRDVMPNKE